MHRRRRMVGGSAVYAIVASAALCLFGVVGGGCARGPTFIPPDMRHTIDRGVIETPAETQIKTEITGLTAPTAFCFIKDQGPYDGALLIAEGGLGGFRPRIFGFKTDGTRFEIYPQSRRVPTFGLIKGANDIYGPIGGMLVTQGKIFVTHRDANGFGEISAFDFDGTRTTVVGGLPAQGDYSVTDIAIHPTTGRLYFGVGAATNSGVVGMDNWAIGWVKRYPKFSDIPLVPLKLLGFRFPTQNPLAGIFGGADIAVTAPFSAFGQSYLSRIPKAPDGKPTSAIYSVSPSGGDLRVEAWGIRLPRGLAFNEYANLFITNNGMELRGTAPGEGRPRRPLQVFAGNLVWFSRFQRRPGADQRRTLPAAAGHDPAQRISGDRICPGSCRQRADEPDGVQGTTVVRRVPRAIGRGEDGFRPGERPVQGIPRVRRHRARAETGRRSRRAISRSKPRSATR